MDNLSDGLRRFFVSANRTLVSFLWGREPMTDKRVNVAGARLDGPPTEPGWYAFKNRLGELGFCEAYYIGKSLQCYLGSVKIVDYTWYGPIVCVEDSTKQCEDDDDE